ncbi:hypothetical protein D3C84_1122730 [compost metagenome]
MTIAVGGVRYSVMVARLRSTCASTYAQARYASALGKIPRANTANCTRNGAFITWSASPGRKNNSNAVPDQTV